MKKRMNLSILAAAGLMTVGMTGTAFALHSGGVAHCDACHSMHATTTNVVGTGNTNLMKGSDASSTCLNCHESSSNGTGYHISSPDGSATNQGGDFYWMKTDIVATVRGNPVTSHASSHGHSIIAADFGFVVDPNNPTAPGGTYDATLLGCTSCHDAHGQVNGGTAAGQLPISGSGSTTSAAPPAGTILGNYRLLGDASYVAGGAGDGFTFTNPIPVALGRNVSGASYNAQVDYGSGMSEWCANCHTDYLSGQQTTLMHPAGNDIDLGVYLANYNAYMATGNFVPGSDATSYDSLVPFERGTTDKTTLDPQSTAGPDANSNVMCLTCHRAHGSAFEHGTRWDMDTELLASKGVYALAVAAGMTDNGYYKDGAAITIAGEYGPYQRSLCNKCHVQD